MKTCVICGKEFTPCNRVQKTCSKACSRELGRRSVREYRRQKPVSDVPLNSLAARRLNGEILCMWCGKEFTTKNPLDKFCCDDHAQKFFAQLLNH